MARVLILIPSMAGVGGTERMVAGIARILSESHEVHVAAFDPPGTRPHFDLGVPFHPLGAERHRPLWSRWLTYRTQVRALKKLEERLRIEVTLSNLWRADLLSAFAGKRLKRVALAHINVADNPTNRKMVQMRAFTAWIYRRFDQVVAVSSALAEELKDLYRLKSDQVTPIENFVEITTPPHVQKSIDSPELIWCGRMVDEKNVPTLVPIVEGIRKIVPSAKLVIVGDGPMSQEVRKLAFAANLSIGDCPAIEFKGSVPDPAPMIARASMMLLPSHSEGLPMVLLEALALGVPVAAADCRSGGVHSALAGRTPHNPDRGDVEVTACGILLPVPRGPDDVERIAIWSNTLGNLLADRARLSRLSRGAFERSEIYSATAAQRKWNAVVSQLVAA